MALAPEQVRELKEQLAEQIQHLPPQQKEAAQKQIDSMSAEALEAMIRQQQSGKGKQSQKGIFRSIIDREMPSRIIEDSKDCLAVLDIKPISKGHLIIIPKKAVSDIKQMPSSAFSLAKKIARRMESKLQAKGCEIQTEFKFGEIIINVIPVYNEGVSINSPRTNPKEEELDHIQKKLQALKRTKKPKPQSTTIIQNIEKIILKRRIP